MKERNSLTKNGSYFTKGDMAYANQIWFKYNIDKAPVMAGCPLENLKKIKIRWKKMKNL
jgi:hypothetical protein